MLYTKVIGKGSPILFIGGLTASTRYWGNHFNALSKQHRLIYVDILGFGRSPRPATKYTLDLHLEEIAKTLRILLVRRVSIIAHSFGTVLAAYFAARYPHLVKRIILLGVPIIENRAQGVERVKRFAPAMAFLTFHPILGRLSCYLHNSFPYPSRMLARRLLQLPAAVADDCLEHTWNSYSDTMEILISKPIGRALNAIHCPVLLIHGTGDRITDVTTVERTAKKIGARLVITDDRHQSYVHGKAKRTLEIINAQTRI